MIFVLSSLSFVDIIRDFKSRYCLSLSLQGSLRTSSWNVLLSEVAVGSLNSLDLLSQSSYMLQALARYLPLYIALLLAQAPEVLSYPQAVHQIALSALSSLSVQLLIFSLD